MLLKVHPDNPSERKVAILVDCLKNGGVVIYPTDTVYALGCDIHQKNSIERIARIKGVDPRKTHFSFVFSDLSHASEYTKNFDKSVFKVLRKNVPGPFTFILNCNQQVPKLLQSKKKTIGIRIPDNNIAQAMVGALGSPIVSTSLVSDSNWDEMETNAEMIYESYGKLVDMVVDGGDSGTIPSTVVNLISGGIEIMRSGLGELKD